MLRDVAAAHDFVGVQDQMLQQGVLPRGQCQGFPSTARTAGTRVQFEDSRREESRVLEAAAPGE